MYKSNQLKCHRYDSQNSTMKSMRCASFDFKLHGNWKTEQTVSFPTSTWVIIVPIVFNRLSCRYKVLLHVL
jgi:hypothetical protein